MIYLWLLNGLAYLKLIHYDEETSDVVILITNNLSNFA